MRLCLIITLATGISACFFPTSAGAAVPSDSVRIMHAFGEASVRVVRIKSNVKSTVPIQEISDKDFDKQGVVSVGDALKRFAGISLRDYGGAGGLKTVSVRGLGAAHTAVSYDGINVTDQQNGQIDLSGFSTDQLQSISLSIADGTNLLQTAKASAAAASINLVSKGTSHNDFKPHVILGTSYGSFSMVNPMILYEQRYSKKTDVSFSANFLHSKNNYPFTLTNGSLVTKERRDNSQINALHAETNVRYKTQRSLISSKLYYYDNARHLPGIVIYYNPYNSEKLHEKTAFWQNSLKSQLNKNLTFLANTKLNWSESRYSDYNGKYPGGELHQNYWQREAYASGVIEYKFPKHFKVAYAADYSYNTLNSNLSTATHVERHSILQTLSAGYSAGNLALMARMLGSVYLNEADGDSKAENLGKITPSVSASLRPFQNIPLVFRAFYKEIFRMPTFTESYYYHIGNTELKPETTSQIGLGVTLDAALGSGFKQLTVTLDGYHNRIRDKITAVPENLYIWRMINFGKVDACGFDATLKAGYEINRDNNIFLTASYTFQQVENRTLKSDKYYGLQLAYTPKSSGSASLAWENPIISVSLSCIASSSRYSTNEHAGGTRMPGYAEFGFTVYRSFKISGTRLDLRGDVQNLMNKQYDVINHYPMPGRNARLSLSITL